MYAPSSFKIKYNNFCKMIPIPESLEKLVSLIKNAFQLPEDNLFSLSYIDEENDIISVSDIMDFSHLINLSKSLKKTITIKVSSEKNTKESLKSISKLNIYQQKQNYIYQGLNNIYNYLLNGLTAPFKKDLSSNYLNKNLNFNTRNNNDSLTINLNLINNGKLNWPNPSFLTCLKYGSGIIGKRVKINKEISSSNSIEIKIILDLSNIKDNGKFISLWQLFDEKGNSYGNVFTISVNCIFDDSLKIKPEFIEVYEHHNDIKTISTDEFLIKKGLKKENDLNELVNEIKKESNNLFLDDAIILNTLIKCNQNKKMTLEILKYEYENNIHYHKY